MSSRSIGASSFYGRYVKRLVDLLTALVVLPLLALAALVVGPAILLEDGAPVFFKGERRGRSGTPFKMYKFRSMAVGAPDLRNGDGSTVNGNADPRITRVGRLIRKTSIDELPQVLNVLRGEMSFVGPRPDMSTRTWGQLSGIEQKRLKVRPGITGLAQALYRNSISAEEKREIDGIYVDTLSLMRDLEILLRTVKTVATARGVDAGTSGGES